MVGVKLAQQHHDVFKNPDNSHDLACASRYLVGNTVQSQQLISSSHSKFCHNHVVIGGSVVHVLHTYERVLVQEGWSRVDIVDAGVKAAGADGVRPARQLPGVFEPHGFYLDS